MSDGGWRRNIGLRLPRGTTIATADEHHDNRPTDSDTATTPATPPQGRSCPNSPLVKRSYRLIILGSTQTGKTCVVNRFLSNDFTEKYMPTIENFHRKVYKIKGDLYQLDIVDTSGNDPFPAAKRLSLVSGDLFLLVCSVDNAASVMEVFSVIKDICDCKHSRRSAVHRSKQKVPIVVAVNKIDLTGRFWRIDMSVFQEQIEKIREEQPSCTIEYVECSAKSTKGIDELFADLFQAARLPKQMSPYMHRLLEQKHSAHARLSNERSLPGAERISPLMKLKKFRFASQQSDEPPVSIYQETGIRRPSLRTDLLLMKTHMQKTSKERMLPTSDSHSNEDIPTATKNPFAKSPRTNRNKCSIC